jgi:xanthine dehydrogenase molybdopterin-binding subunit B
LIGAGVAGSILGNRVLRKEDPKFLTTGGVYVDDLHDEPLLAGALHATYVRSTVAHANILGIDVSEALLAPGVVAIYTAADLGLQPTPATYNPTALRTLLATEKVRYVGEPIAVILTERADQGEDAKGFAMRQGSVVTMVKEIMHCDAYDGVAAALGESHLENADYFIWDGCSRAVHDYLSKTQSTDRIRHSPEGVAYLVKGAPNTYEKYLAEKAAHQGS